MVMSGEDPGKDLGEDPGDESGDESDGRDGDSGSLRKVIQRDRDQRSDDQTVADLPWPEEANGAFSCGLVDKTTRFASMCGACRRPAGKLGVLNESSG
jgi:hypothetical protein